MVRFFLIVASFTTKAVLTRLTVFALVTSSASLIAYNIHLFHKAIAILTWGYCHAWSRDRCVKVWNLWDKLTMDKDDAYMSCNSNTVDSRADSINTDSSMDNDSRYSDQIVVLIYVCLPMLFRLSFSLRDSPMVTSILGSQTG
jgi:hypothetical protein